MKFPSQKIVVSLVCVFCAAIFMIFANPFKVTDPADPRFNPDQFKFSDYHHFFEQSELPAIFKKLFPPGTSKEFIDRVLVQAGSATASKEKNFRNVWTYRQPPRWYFFKGPPSHIFSFDASNKLININAFRANILFPQNKTYLEQKK